MSEPDFSPGILQDSLELTAIPLFRNPILLHQKYVVEGLSIRQIAAEFFSSKEAVRNGLLRAGIKVREAHKPHGRPSQSRYGRRRTMDREIDHHAEQRTIALAKKMHAGGMSLREIAACLTRMGVPTKKGASKWHPYMVKRILRNS